MARAVIGAILSVVTSGAILSVLTLYSLCRNLFCRLVCY